MSHDIVGADLAQLDELSTAFHTAGTAIAAKATTLDEKIQTAILRFETSLSTLRSEAATLAGTIDDEIDAVRNQADGVQWTGSNRTAFDGDLATFTVTVHDGTARIDTDITAITTRIDSGFTPVLADFGIALRRSGDEVDTAATDMEIAVADQRSALDQVANVGWANA